MSDELVGEITPAQRFDEATLRAYLEARIDGFGRDMIVQQIKGGASNPTFKLTAQGQDGPLRYVLRKKPPGQLLASAHQVDREYRVMKALDGTGVPVPRMRHLCQDETVIGTAFYVMDFLDGRIFRDATLPGLSRLERAAIYDQLNATLAKLHQVDYVARGLADFGRARGYFERQVSRWIKQYRGAETENIPAMEQLIAELPALIPTDQSVSIAHGDYRLENTMFHPMEPRLIAVLDWELCTIGHPLADIAYNCFQVPEGQSWGSLSTSPQAAFRRNANMSKPTAATGRSAIENWNLSFGVFRLASISQVSIAVC
jgi:aminoglycoside phosphotransferase (APT) family kinase protein